MAQEQPTPQELDSIDFIQATTPEGKEIRFEIKEQLEYWKNFYKEEGIDWVTLPDDIYITPEQKIEMKRLIENLGFDKMIILPEGLTDTGDKYKKIFEKLTQGKFCPLWLSRNFVSNGGFETLKNSSENLRILLTKKALNARDDTLIKQTKEKSLSDLKKGIFKEKKIRGMDLASYLVLQREYYKENGQFIDAFRTNIWLPEMTQNLSDQIMYTGMDGYLNRYIETTFDERKVGFWCRLAGTFEINDKADALKKWQEEVEEGLY